MPPVDESLLMRIRDKEDSPSVEWMDEHGLLPRGVWRDPKAHREWTGTVSERARQIQEQLCAKPLDVVAAAEELKFPLKWTDAEGKHGLDVPKTVQLVSLIDPCGYTDTLANLAVKMTIGLGLSEGLDPTGVTEYDWAVTDGLERGRMDGAEMVPYMGKSAPPPRSPAVATAFFKIHLIKPLPENPFFYKGWFVADKDKEFFTFNDGKPFAVIYPVQYVPFWCVNEEDTGWNESYRTASRENRERVLAGFQQLFDAAPNSNARHNIQSRMKLYQENPFASVFAYRDRGVLAGLATLWILRELSAEGIEIKDVGVPYTADGLGHMLGGGHPLDFLLGGSAPVSTSRMLNRYQQVADAIERTPVPGEKRSGVGVFDSRKYTGFWNESDFFVHLNGIGYVRAGERVLNEEEYELYHSLVSEYYIRDGWE